MAHGLGYYGIFYYQSGDEIIEEEIILQFGLPRRIFSDNATSFTEGLVEEYMKGIKFEWKAMLP